MQISPINNQSFKGRITVSGLSSKQQKAFNPIYPELEKQVKPIKNLILRIDGSMDKNSLSVSSGKDPKYILMVTQLKSATVPIVQTATDSTDSDILLDTAQDVILRHVKSQRYIDSISSQFKLKDETIASLEKTTGLTYEEMTTLSTEKCKELMIERGTMKKPNPIKKWFSNMYRQIGEKLGLLEKQHDIYTHID